MAKGDKNEFYIDTCVLSIREWIAVAIVCVLVFTVSPMLWKQFESFEPGDDYRNPDSLGADYYHFERWVKRAAESHDVLMFGDSVVWGQFVAPDETLPHFLNELAGAPFAANLGVNGMHPAAMDGLVREYGSAVRNKKVIMVLNTLMVSSPKFDLRDRMGDDEFQFNHPRLVPQFIPDVPLYEASFKTRATTWLDHHVRFPAWQRHVKTVYYDGREITDWTLDSHYDEATGAKIHHYNHNPFSPIHFNLPAPAVEAKFPPISWRERRTPIQDFRWVLPEDSLQIAMFMRALRTLESRGNSVLVLINPFNTHLLTPESAERFAAMTTALCAYFTENNVTFHALTTLPSEEYADTNHALKGGYKRMAIELLENHETKRWLGHSAPATTEGGS